MGSKGHQHDLELVEDALVKLMHEIPQLRFEVFGTIKMPTKLEQFGHRVESHSVNKNYFEFIEYLATLNWDIGLAPLVNEVFNHCKAPTKYIEYTSAGIPVVATDIGVYRDAAHEKGVVLVKDNDWFKELSRLVKDSEARYALLRNARYNTNERYAKNKLTTQVRNLLNKFIQFKDLNS